MSLFSGIGSGVNDGFILLSRGGREKLTLVEGLPTVGTFLGLLPILSFNSSNSPTGRIIITIFRNKERMAQEG